jgi:hypothetical protein
VTSLSFFFSQDAGICSLVATGSFVALRALARRERKGLARQILLGAAGFLAAALPLLLYFSFKDALGPFISELIRYPLLFSLGFEASPFPDFEDFLADPLGTRGLLHYSVIAVYILTSVSLVTRLILGRRDRDTLLRFALLIFGILLFRSALGRSDEYHALYSSPPAFLLVFLMADYYGVELRRFTPYAVKGWYALVIASLLAGVVIPFRFTILKHRYAAMADRNRHPELKLRRIVTGSEVPRLERAGVFFERKDTRDFVKIGNFLAANTRPGSFVYFFPNEPLYYFLFNRRNPTEFNTSYLAATRKQRVQLIADLEEKRPRFVIYSLDTWRIDNIPEETQEPEVVAYLHQKYRMYRDMENILVLERIEEAEHGE